MEFKNVAEIFVNILKFRLENIVKVNVWDTCQINTARKISL